METYLSFLLFVMIMTVTPGPGNLTMMAIGQNGGLRRGLPLLLGSSTGFHLICWLTALGLARIFTEHAILFTAMKSLGICYICYLGWRLLQSRILPQTSTRWFTFLDGLLLHPLSPKSWAMCIVGFSQFCDPARPLLPQALLFVLTFCVFQVSCHTIWCLSGSLLLRLFGGTSGRIVSITMVALMISSSVYAMFAA